MMISACKEAAPASPLNGGFRREARRAATRAAICSDHSRISPVAAALDDRAETSELTLEATDAGRERTLPSAAVKGLLVVEPGSAAIGRGWRKAEVSEGYRT